MRFSFSLTLDLKLRREGDRLLVGPSVFFTCYLLIFTTNLSSADSGKKEGNLKTVQQEDICDVDKMFKNESRTEIQSPQVLKIPINIPEKLLMGPGPSNVSPRVLQALSLPVIGHFHKEFFKVMDDIKAGLKYVFQTSSPWTLALSGPGHLGMECVLNNLIEPADKIVVGVNGLWGIRAADNAMRLGAQVHKMEKESGKSFSKAEISEVLQRVRPKVLFLVHSESSSGVMQNLEGIGEICQSYNTLLVVDAVASLGGVPFYMDRWKIDAVYSGSQKNIGAPPGLAPISFGPRAIQSIESRSTPIKSFLLDMNLLTNYWDCRGDGVPRAYHHTPPVNLMYALREALAVVAEEGLENMWERHRKATQKLYEGLRTMGLEFYVEDEEERLPTVTTVKIPHGLKDWKHVTEYAMDKYMIEISGGLGSTVGKVFRIGIMGYNASPPKVDRVLQALREGIEFSKLHGRL